MTITTTRFRLPTPSRDTHIRALSQRVLDRITDIAGTTLELSNPAAYGIEAIFKNGLRLDPGVAYTLSADGTAIELSVAAIGADVFLADYYYRVTRGAT